MLFNRLDGFYVRNQLLTKTQPAGSQSPALRKLRRLDGLASQGHKDC